MITYLANPERFLRFERYASPIAFVLFFTTLLVGLWVGLFTSPESVKHGQGVRLMYVHVPAAYGAMMAYTGITIASFVSFIWRHNLADIAARALAFPGVVFTALALITGSLWGKPAWGVWWAWDGRMTSVLVLFFIYIAYMCIWALIEPANRAARIAAIFAMIGFINIPIIKYSVEWWNGLHQSATISDVGAPGLDSAFLFPLLIMVASYTGLLAWITFRTMRTEILRRKQHRKAMTEKQASITIKDL